MNNLVDQCAVPGIPNKFSFRRLTYNPVAGVLLVEAETMRSGYPVRRIFKRHKDASMYELIQEPGARVSHSSVVACGSDPSAYFLVYEIVGTERPCGANWVGISRVDCDSDEVKVMLKRRELTLPYHYGDAWVIEIVNCWSGGGGLDCIVAMKSLDKSEIKYNLSQLDLKRKLVNPIAELRGCVY